MKHSLYFHRSPVKFLIPIAVITGFIFTSCKNPRINSDSFYYSGDTKTEITIISDTLGILLKDTVLNPQDTSGFYFDKVVTLADSSLNSQGYISAGNLEKDPHIKLVLNKNQNLTKNNFIDQLNQVRSGQNSVFVANAGYLVRIKGTNRPMILTDEIVIVFKPGTTQSARDSVFDAYKLNVLRRGRFDSLQYTVVVTKNTPHDVLRMSHILKDNKSISLAQLNFIYAKKTLAVRPTDDLFDEQWSLINSRPDATEDADIDADLAWDFTMGSESTVLAVIDEGFDTLHPDLRPNFLINNPETQGNNVDDDSNGFTDDYLGWNFDGAGNGNNNLDGYKHGTAVLGLANAVRDDVTGIVGSCPGCRSLLIKSGHTVEQDADAFYYARLRGAKVINCSWEVSSFEPLLITAINAVISSGITVVFAMANGDTDYCSSTPGILQPSQQRFVSGDAIFISRSTSKDSYDKGGWGDCMTVLTPSGVFGSPAGYLKLFTTDKLDEDGYNDATFDTECSSPYRDPDYTSCFWGTSAAAPITAGVAGLILSAKPLLTPQQVEYLMQDCADKIENSKANYSPVNGKSISKTHGYGRLNAYEAVKIASPILDKGGRNGVDIFLRDHPLDWGNTEKPTSYSFEPTRGTVQWWKSQDIKIDAPDASSNFSPPADSKAFEDFIEESPVANKTNRVYVRVRNRGFNPAATVQVKLYWVYGGLAMPALWTNFPRDIVGDATWHFLGNVTLNNVEYSGASVAYYGVDKAQIATFDFTAPMPDPSQRNHYCLVALVDSPEDPLTVAGVTSLDDATKGFNNISHRNYSIATPAEKSLAADVLTMYNPYPFPAPTKISIINPKNIKIKMNNLVVDTVFTLKPKEQKKFTFTIDSTGTNSPGEITLLQEFISPGKKEKKILGGFTIYYGNQKMTTKKVTQ